MEANPYPLGRLVEHDPRSRNFPARAALIKPRPIVWRRYGPVLDQGTLGSCTGNSMAHALNSRPLRKLGSRILREEDAVGIYQDATRIDPFPGEYPPDDTGSSGLAVCKVAKNRGLISGYNHAFSAEQARAAIQTGPALFGTWWHNSMFQPDSRGYVHPDGNKVGGHEILIVGDDMTKLIIQNSWGPGWGRGGRFYLTYTDFEQLMMDDGDVTIPVK
jgi:hypothetical protein